MADEKEWFRLDNLPSKVLLLLGSVSIYLFGLFSQAIAPYLKTISENIPREVLLAGLLLLLALLTSSVAFLIHLWNENRHLKQKPVWHPQFGANWRYWPLKKKFDSYPFCICCPDQPLPFMIFEKNRDLNVEPLVCPSKRTDKFEAHRHQIYLRDLNGNWLSVQAAISRLPSRLN